MGNRRKRQGNVATPPPPNKRRVHGTAIVALAAAVLALVAARLWVPRHTAAPSSPAPAAVLATPPATAAETRTDFQKLAGKWLRPDGGYVLEVSGVDADGKMDAAYFNPRSIHVARATATAGGDATKVFVELRDVNYPGSTYTLAYDAQSDQLKGVYFQALLGQNFEVFFVRMR